MQLRDFPKPLVDSSQLRIHGTLLGAENEAAECAVRKNRVFTGENRDDIVVGRKMPALKFYHDLYAHTARLEITWGVAYDYPLSDIGSASDYMTKPTVDPSPVLPWWDKMRLILHGRVVIKSDQLW